MIRTYIPLLLLTLTLFACKDDDPENDPNAPCTYNNSVVTNADTSTQNDVLIPLKVGNFWVYADTLWDSNANIIATMIDTNTITRSLFIQSDLWWEYDAQGPSQHISGNNLFALSGNGQTGDCKVKQLSFYVPGTMSDTILQNIIVDGEIATSYWLYHVPDTIVTAAGTFTNLVVKEDEAHNKVWFQEDIGVVQLEQSNRKRILIDYHFNN